MSTDDEQGQRMREFLVLWRLRAGPMTRERLEGTLGLEANGDGTGTLSRVLEELSERGLVTYGKEEGTLELTQEGKELVEGTSHAVTSGFVEMCKKEKKEREEEG